MEVVSDLQLQPASWGGGAVTIGNFDGVHRGHRSLIQRLQAEARRVSGPAVAVTFSPHPIQILRPGQLPPPLSTLDRKLELLEEAGVDICITYPTTPELLALSAEQFFQQVVVRQLDARAVVEGPNFHFGRDRQGDTKLLEALTRQQGISLAVVEPQRQGGAYISSSRIRDAIARGEIEAANDWLGYPYRVEGVVGEGARRGSQIGFPTANVQQVATLLPAHGVYAGHAWVPAHPCVERHLAAIHIGPNPTFQEGQTKFEVHLLDFDGDLYGQTVAVEFTCRLRDVATFGSVQELINQLQRDVASIRNLHSGSTL